MIDLLHVCAFHAAYAQTIDGDDLERWPYFFTETCHYRITNDDNIREGLAAGMVYASSRAMLEDRVTALRQANIYERHRYRHLIGMPHFESQEETTAQARTPFIVARIMHGGETTVFATGEYRDRFAMDGRRLLLAERVVVCDSTVTDTLLVLPL